MNKKRQELEFFAIAKDSVPSIPIATVEVHAGFPCPVDDAYMSQPIDLNKELIKHPASSYLVRVAGDSMCEEGIDEGDLLVVDRSTLPSERNISVVMYAGEFALKRIVNKGDKIYLMAGNSHYAPIIVDDASELRVFGVVEWIIKKK